MIAHNFDFDGYFAGSEPAQKNPIVQGQFLLGPNQTLVAPPDAGSYTADQIPIFNEDLEQWELVDSPEKIANDNALFALTNEEGVLLYEDDGNGIPVARDQADVDAETQAIVDARALSENLGNIRETMDNNIIVKAMEITKGTTIESVQAFTQAFHLRANNPAEYVAEGLVVRYAWGSYAIDDALDTEAKISEYYSGIMIELDKFREAEIATYLAAKFALENP